MKAKKKALAADIASSIEAKLTEAGEQSKKVKKAIEKSADKLAGKITKLFKKEEKKKDKDTNSKKKKKKDKKSLKDGSSAVSKISNGATVATPPSAAPAQPKTTPSKSSVTRKPAETEQASAPIQEETPSATA